MSDPEFTREELEKHAQSYVVHLRDVARYALSLLDKRKEAVEALRFYADRDAHSHRGARARAIVAAYDAEQEEKP